MSSTWSFRALIVRLHDADHVGVALSLVQDVLDECRTWDADQTRTWLVDLAVECREFDSRASDFEHLESELDDEAFSGLAVTRAVARLAEALMRRLCELRDDLPIDELHSMVRSAALIPVTLDLPRSFLIPAYYRWIENMSLPAVIEYARQAHRKAVPVDQIKIASAVEETIEPMRSEAEPDWLEIELGWQLAAVRSAMSRDVKTARRWAGNLLRHRDAFEEESQADLDFIESWVNDVETSQIPPGISEYLQLARIDKETISLAEASMGEGDWRSSSELVKAMFERDRRISNPKLPSHVATAVEGLVETYLLSYRRLARCGGDDHVSQCALLTLAIEEQLRRVMSEGQGDEPSEAIRSMGLRGLVDFLIVRYESSLTTRFGLKPVVDDLKLLGRLDAAADLRNKLHHSLFEVSPSEVDELDTAIFNKSRDFGRMMERIGKIRCKGPSQ